MKIDKGEITMSWKDILKMDFNLDDFDHNTYPDISNAVDIFLDMQEWRINYELEEGSISDAEAKKEKEKLEEVVNDAYNQLTQEDLDNSKKIPPKFDMHDLLLELSRNLNFKVREKLQ